VQHLRQQLGRLLPVTTGAWRARACRSQIARRTVGLLIVASAAGAPTTTAASMPSGGDQTITGQELVLKDDSDPAKRALSAVSTDATITLGNGAGSADDPTSFGGSVRVQTPAGDLFDATNNLPAIGWKTIGLAGQIKGYQFTSKTGPIKHVVVRPGKQVKVTGRGAFTQTLSTNPDPVDVVLRMGAKRFCMTFGGTETFQANKRYRAKSAPAPSSCPAAADWPMYGFDLGRSRFNPQEGLINRQTVSRLNVQWFFSTGSGTGAVSASPSVVDGVVYVGSWNGTMYALDASTGQPVWTFDIDDPHPGDRNGFPGIQSSAAVEDGIVYFGAADANVYALDAHTGALVWKTALGNPDTSVEGAHVWSSPAVFDGKVYVGKSSHIDAPCVRGALFALDAASGAPVWRFDSLPAHVCSNDAQKPCMADPDCPGGSCVPFLVCRSGSGEQPQTQRCSTDSDCTAPATCQQPIGGGVTSSPAIDATTGAVYSSVGDCVGSGATGFAESLVALDADTGALRWSFKPIAAGDLQDLDFVASPNLFTATEGMITESLVGAGNKNGTYYAVDRITGAPVWQKAAVPGGVLGGFNASTGVAFGTIYAGTFTGPPFIFALGATDGSVAWQCPNATCGAPSFGPPGIAAGVVFVGDTTGTLRAFDAATGTVLRALDLGGGISSGPAVVNDMVVVGAGTGAFGSGQKQGVYGLTLR
jgi:polyvinyl alcohol dehydrogenase (cytochrome)